MKGLLLLHANQNGRGMFVLAGDADHRRNDAELLDIHIHRRVYFVSGRDDYNEYPPLLCWWWFWDVCERGVFACGYYRD